ncbi:MAG: hypothetical protein ABL898_09745 [Hyphomicrobiaceae bacterium]|nr:hypothetical protein [Hyphomicrobiaceae bacterium]
MTGRQNKTVESTAQTAKVGMLVLLVASSMFLASEVVRMHGNPNSAPLLMSTTGSPTGTR